MFISEFSTLSRSLTIQYLSTEWSGARPGGVSELLFTLYLCECTNLIVYGIYQSWFIYNYIYDSVVVSETWYVISVSYIGASGWFG